MAFVLVSGADWAKVVYFKIYAAFTGTAVHSSPVWMDARPLCVSGVCRMMFACDTLCTVQFHTLTYPILFAIGLRPPSKGGVSKLKLLL